MKVTVKTLKGEIIDIEVEPATTVYFLLIFRFCKSNRNSKKSKDLRSKVKKSFLKEKQHKMKILFKNLTLKTRTF